LSVCSKHSLNRWHGVSQDTKDRIVSAAIASLKEDGYAGASARAIAARGNFNQALVFYHFGSVRGALLAALDRTSAQRMAAYQSAAADANDIPTLVAVASAIYHEDLASGHMKVLAELVAGASTDPELGPAIVERVEPWIDFAHETLARVLADTPFASFLPAGDVAYAIVAQFLGLELLTHLDGGTERADRLFGLAERVANLVAGPSSAGRAG
jgi:AcrR family transcriptional regulator